MKLSNTKHILRILCLTMSVVLVLCCFSSCKNSGDEYSVYESIIEITPDSDSEANNNGNTDDKVISNNTSSAVSSTDKDVSAKPVETKGKTFTIVSDLLPVEESKDNQLFEKVFFERVREVEEEYGCEIKIINTLFPSPKNLAPMISAGKKIADVIEVELRNLPALSTGGYLKPWNEIKGINTSDSKYIPSYTKLATIGKDVWGLQFEKPPEVRYCMIMNKNLLKSANIDPDEIYSMIENKTWNYDKLLEYAKATTDASKGIYGVGGRPDYVAEMLLASNNARLVTMDSKGKATSTYTSKNVIDAMNFLNRMINTDKVFMTSNGMFDSSTYDSSIPDYTDQFIKGKIAFLFEDSWVLNQQIRPKVKNFDYGMIMIPLGPGGNQYVSPAEHARVFTVTSTNTELDFTAKIFNELAKSPSGYSGDNWWKEEIQLDYFQKGDTKSMDIYLRSLENSTWDIGAGIDALNQGFKNTVVFDSMFWKKKGLTPEAAINSLAGTYDKTINDLFNK